MLYNLEKPHVKQCAVILKNDKIEKIYNFPAQYNDLSNDPNVIIYEDCNLNRLDEKADYWNRIVNYDYNKEREKEKQFQTNQLKEIKKRSDESNYKKIIRNNSKK